MLKLIKKHIALIFAVLLFTGSVTVFLTSRANASEIMSDCSHCGSISACEDGGQEYGMTECDIHYGKIGTPEGCHAHGECCGTSQCLPGQN